MTDMKDYFLVTNATDYYDDCPICKAIKQSEATGEPLTLPEIKAAFIESRKAGGIIGLYDADLDESQW